MQDDDRTVPTLETIPAELKLVIADYFDPDVPLDLRWSQVAQYESQSRRAAVRSLSLVSRNWAVALEDLKWQTLHLRATDTKHLLHLARDYMPRCGSKVKTLVLTWWTDADLEKLPLESNASNFQQALEAAESFTGLKSSWAPTLPEICALQDALIATILQACSNLVDLTVLQHMNTVHNLVTPQSDEVGYYSWMTQRVLQHIGGMITAAGLSLRGANDEFYLAVISSLELMLNIKHLSLRVVDESFDDEMRDLVSGISKLQQLVSLELDTASITAWLELQIYPPKNMTQFILSGVQHLQLMQLADFLTATPIVSLSLRNFSVAHFQLPFRRPDNLRIENLSISGCTAPSLLDLFDSAPLKSVEFCADHRGRSDRNSPKRLRAFIRKHRDTLLSVKVHQGALDPSADVSGINHSLEREGISVRVKTFR